MLLHLSVDQNGWVGWKGSKSQRSKTENVFLSFALLGKEKAATL